MKRYVETNRWRDPWYRKLSGRAKNLWAWLCDHCDNAGVIDLDMEAASFDIGEAVKEQHFREIQSRLHRLPNGKLWITKFIQFQYGNLSAKCIPHLRVLELLSSHGIKYPEMLEKSTTQDTTLVPTLDSTFNKEQDKEEEEDKEEGVQGEDNSTPASRIIATLNELTGSQFRPVGECLEKLNARLSELGVTESGVIQMINRQAKLWLNDPKMVTFLRPSTLFRPTNFNEYYAARELPIPDINGRSDKPNPRNFGIVGTTVYGQIKPRLQRELEEKKRLAEQVATTQGNPPTGDGGPILSV